MSSQRSHWKFGKFFSAIWKDWFALVTTIGSFCAWIASGVFELFGSPFPVMLSLVFAGMATLVIAAYRIWKVSDDALDEANEKLNPKVRILGVAPHPEGDDYRRIRVQNLTATAVRFKAKLLEAKPGIALHLPIDLRGTHVLPGGEMEIEPKGQHSVDVFIDYSLRPDVYPNKSQLLGLVVVGNPPCEWPVPRNARLELLICVYPTSVPGARDARWFYVVPQQDGRVAFTGDGHVLLADDGR